MLTPLVTPSHQCLVPDVWSCRGRWGGERGRGALYPIYTLRLFMGKGLCIRTLCGTGCCFLLRGGMPRLSLRRGFGWEHVAGLPRGRRPGLSLRRVFGGYPGSCWFYESLRHFLLGGCRRPDCTGSGAESTLVDGATTQVDVWTKKGVREGL